MAKPTTEELDEQQFGRALHVRPSPTPQATEAFRLIVEPWLRNDMRRHIFPRGSVERLTKYASKALAAEREACAKIAEGFAPLGADPNGAPTREIADAIRNRSKT